MHLLSPPVIWMVVLVAGVLLSICLKSLVDDKSSSRLLQALCCLVVIVICALAAEYAGFMGESFRPYVVIAATILFLAITFMDNYDHI